MKEGTVMDLYLEQVLRIINDIHMDQKPAILRAARMVADQVKQDRVG